MIAPLVAPPHARRVELVVTDGGMAGGAGGKENGGAHQEVRCTIPLALIDESFSGETLNDMACFKRPWHATLISADDLMLLLTNLVDAIQRPQATYRPTDTDDADFARIERLTPREREVLGHVVAGDPNKRTAALLNISRRTVEHHRASIMQKTRTKSVSELVRLALRTGLFAAADQAHA